MKGTPKNHVLDFKAVIVLDTWAGRRKYRIRVTGETKKYIKFEALESIPLPKKRLQIGEMGRAPKYCVITDGNEV